MPGEVHREGSKWVLTWGSRRYEHETREDAERQRRALYANEPKAKGLVKGDVSMGTDMSMNGSMSMSEAARRAMSEAGRGSYAAEDMLRARREMHRAAEMEKEFSPEVLDAERVSCAVLRSLGFDQRYDDALSKAAGTGVKNPKPPSMEEVMMHLDGGMGLDTMPMMLCQDMETGEMSIDIRNPMMKSASESIMRAMNRMMPPSMRLETMKKGGDPNCLMKVAYPYTLQLSKRGYGAEFQVTTRGSLERGLRASAAGASAVFKSASRLPFRLIKGLLEEIKAKAAPDMAMERIVTAVILEPEVPDATQTKESEADIYSEGDIQKAMYWWMEHANHAFAYYHQQDGGQILSSVEVPLLENWQTRVDQTIGKQAIRKGSWVASARINDEALWQAILKGDITGWSVGMYAMGQIEQVEDPAA